MSRFARLSTRAACTLLVALIAPVSRAQDDPDLSLATDGRCLEFAYASDGTLVVAWVVPGARRDTLVVQSRTDPTAPWTVLWNDPLAGLLDRIVDLSLALAFDYPNSGADKKLFLGLHATWKSGNTELGFTGLLSGSYTTPWTSPYCAEVMPDGGPSYARPWPDMKVSCAVLPLIGGSVDDYAVGVAFKYPLFSSESIQVALSLDHGGKTELARIVAGPGGEVVDRRGLYGWPSLIGDSVNREVVIAFDDEDSFSIVMGATQVSAFVGGGPLAWVWESPANNNGREHHGVLGHFDGELNLACLFGEAVRNGAYKMTWFYGSTAAGLNEVFDFNGDRTFRGDLAVTPPDLEIRGSDARIAALCITDSSPQSPGVGIIAWECGRLGDELVRAQVNDGAVSWADPTRAKVAIAPRGASFRAYSYGWTTTGQAAGTVSIDP